MWKRSVYDCLEEFQATATLRRSVHLGRYYLQTSSYMYEKNVQPIIKFLVRLSSRSLFISFFKRIPKSNFSLWSIWSHLISFDRYLIDILNEQPTWTQCYWMLLCVVRIKWSATIVTLTDGSLVSPNLSRFQSEKIPMNGINGMTKILHVRWLWDFQHNLDKIVAKQA